MSQAGINSLKGSLSTAVTLIEDVGTAHIIGGLLFVTGGTSNGIQTIGSGNFITIVATYDNLTFTEDTGSATPSSGNINIVGGDGIETSGSGDTITISALPFSIAWQTVTSADNPVTLVEQNGYFPDGGAAVNFVLPAAAAVGDTFIIAGEGNLWTIAQNAFQQIVLGVQSSTVGVGGSLVATTISDTVTIVCMTANQKFKVISMIGSPTVI